MHCKIVIKRHVGQRLQEVNGEKVRASLELSSQMKPLGKTRAMFCKTSSVAEKNEGRLEPSWRTIQMTMYTKNGDFGSREAAAWYVVDREGRADEGWTLFTGNLQIDVCTDFDTVLRNFCSWIRIGCLLSLDTTQKRGNRFQATLTEEAPQMSNKMLIQCCDLLMHALTCR